MANKEYDYLFKLVIIGNSAVGKSSLLVRFADDSFSENYLATIGVDFRFKTIPIDVKNVKLQIWDTAGQERFRTITNAYYKGADGIILVYDTTNETSFEDIDQYWMNEVESYGEKNVELLLLGNKSDDSSKRVVSFEKAKSYANKKNMELYETSAKTGKGVEDAFISVAKKLMVKKQAAIAEKKEKAKQKPRDEKVNSEKTKEETNKVTLDSNKGKESQKTDENACQC